jgi:uncharacterized protein
MNNSSNVDMVLYHAKCTDGMGAAWAAWKLLGNRATYIACAHGDPPPDVKGKNVAVLDFCFSNEQTKQMMSEAESFIVIDHHRTAMIELHDIPNTIFDMNHSGAVLAWNYFHPGKEVPKFLNYIEDADLWRWELPYSREFTAAFSMVLFEFEDFERFEDDSAFDDAIKRGSYILAYSKTVIRKIIESAARRRLKGHDVLVVNSSHLISEIGAKLAPECDVALVWHYDHKARMCKVSLRSFHDHVDASEIAKYFGGGGHKKIAGFQINGASNIDSIFDVEEE